MITKLMIDRDSILLNSAKDTNFIYKIYTHEAAFDLKKFNSEMHDLANKFPELSRLKIMLNELQRLGINVDFYSIQSAKLKMNLELIDSRLPEILGYLVYSGFKYGITSFSDLLSAIKDSNPLRFDLTKGHPIYDVKIKAFLNEIALGMNGEALWIGEFDAIKEISVVQKGGESIRYNAYDRTEFQEYLLNNTEMVQGPSKYEGNNTPGFTTKSVEQKSDEYGLAYEVEGELFIKLNLQIRFK